MVKVRYQTVLTSLVYLAVQDIVILIDLLIGFNYIAIGFYHGFIFLMFFIRCFYNAFLDQPISVIG